MIVYIFLSLFFFAQNFGLRRCYRPMQKWLKYIMHVRRFQRMTPDIIHLMVVLICLGIYHIFKIGIVILMKPAPLIIGRIVTRGHAAKTPSAMRLPWAHRSLWSIWIMSSSRYLQFVCILHLFLLIFDPFFAKYRVLHPLLMQFIQLLLMLHFQLGWSKFLFENFIRFHYQFWRWVRTSFF